MIAGALVDFCPNVVNYIISAVLFLAAYGGCAFTITSGFSEGMQWLTVFLFFLGGLAASIAIIGSIVTVIKNFGRKVSVLLIAILITYLKTSQALDDAVKLAFMPDTEDAKYLIITGIYIFVIVILGAFLMKKVQLGEWLEKLSKSADPNAASIFIIVCALYFLLYWILLVQLEEFGWAVGLIIAFLVINFLMLLLSVFLIYKKVRENPKVELKDYAKKEKDNRL